MPIKRLVHNVVTCHPFGVDVVIESGPRTHAGPRIEAGVQLIGSNRRLGFYSMIYACNNSLH